MTHTHYDGSDRPVAAQRVDGERPRDAGRAPPREYPLIREFSTTPATTSKCSRPARCSASTTPTRWSRTSQWDIQLSEDRLHPRGRQVPRHAGDDREPAVRDRAARFGRQVHAARRRAARQALARDRRVAAAPTASRRQCSQAARQGRSKAAFAAKLARNARRRGTDAPTTRGQPAVPRPTAESRPAACAGCCSKQFLRVRARLGGDRAAAQHPRELLDAIGAPKAAPARSRTACRVARLGDAEVRVGATPPPAAGA